jgi:hypothetical protein
MPDFLKPPPGHPHYTPDEPPQPNYWEKLEYEEKDSMDASAAQQQYKELRAKIAAAKKEMETTAINLFKEMSSAFFEANPEIMGFGWTQYTPYWCDGDVCTFSANTDYPTVAVMVGGDLYAYDDNAGNFEVNGVEARTHEDYQRMFQKLGVKNSMSITEDGKTISYDPKTGNITRDGAKIMTHDDYRQLFDVPKQRVAKFLQVFEEEDLQLIFGDHMKVTVTRDGEVETEQYDHD